MKSKAFTLAELIMIIVIVSILAAIAVPRLNFRKTAQRGNCFASSESIRAALANYYSKTAMAGTPSFPDSLSSPAFLHYLADNKLPKHPTGRTWEDYYSLQNNGAQYTFSVGKGTATGACTAL